MTSFIFNKVKFSNLPLDAGWGGLAISIFFPTGEPISPHRLRCGPFAVVHYNFMSHCLAAAAISTRE